MNNFNQIYNILEKHRHKIIQALIKPTVKGFRISEISKISTIKEKKHISR